MTSKDKRRFATVEQRRQIYLDAGGRCGRCGEVLGDDWQAAHMVAWSQGGGTDDGNLAAWCKPCNLSQGAESAILPPHLSLRPWQEQALAVAVDRIYDTGSATVHAAPGAGKTLLAGTVFRRLQRAGLVERLVVVVPNSALRRQWRDSLGTMLAIHVDDEPRDGWMEHRDTAGAVVTYQSLPSTAANHLAELSARPTLVILDEVHHVGEPTHTAWGKAVAKILGDVAAGTVHATGVLNMTGTLFRSSGRQRISTVRYLPDEEDPTKIRADADYSVFTKQLVPESLRNPYVYTYGTEVQMLDVSSAEVIGGDIADLDATQQSAVLRESFTQPAYVEGFAIEAVRMLSLQQEALGRDEPLKLLCVAVDQRSAKRFADAFNKVTGSDFARLVISDETHALKTLRSAARERRSLAIVSVRMVTEGFDCPAVSTIAYASNVTADLSIAQTMARAMRITDTERRVGKIMPAQFLIPDHAAMKQAFARAIVGQMHMLDIDEHVPERGAGEHDWTRPLGPRFEILDLSGPVMRGANVIGSAHGEVDVGELNEWQTHLAAMGVPVVYAPGVIVAARAVNWFPRIYSRDDEVSSKQTSSREASPREMNHGHRQHLNRLSRWMAQHITHDDRWANVPAFQALANEAAGIPNGRRDMASVEELAMAEVWMTARILEHCRTHDEPTPTWISDPEGKA
jgi:superfamily II DNA or RNA helicase